MDGMDIPHPLTRYIFHHSQIVLRPLTPDDIGPLHISCYAQQSQTETGAKLQNSLYWQEKGRRVHLILVTDKGRVVGGGHVGRYGRNAEIADVIIAPDVRRQGLGTILVRSLIHVAQSEEWLPLEIGVLADNTAARDLYLRLGFHQIKEISLADGQSALILKLETIDST